MSALNRYFGCTIKKYFYTKKSAQEAARRRKKVYGVRPRVYECPYCACWHHTTKPLEKEIKDDTKR